MKSSPGLGTKPPEMTRSFRRSSRGNIRDPVIAGAHTIRDLDADFAAPLFSAEITGIGERAYRLVLAGSDREASIPNPDSLDVFITSAKGTSVLGCGPSPRHRLRWSGWKQHGSFGRIHRSEPARLSVGFAARGWAARGWWSTTRTPMRRSRGNTGQFEFDVFLAPRETRSNWWPRKAAPSCSRSRGTCRRHTG